MGYNRDITTQRLLLEKGVRCLNVILEVKDLAISFGSNEVLKSVNFSLQQNEVLGVIGPNGAGKTVMLDILTGILHPSKGSVLFENKEIVGQKITERCRAGIGRTFQVPKPFEKMTVLENIMVGCVYGAGLRERIAKEKAVEIAEFIGLGNRVSWFAGKLGLLERKRLEIGRALATQPKILLLDEVAGGLSEEEVKEIIDLVKKMQDSGVSIVWIEHIIRTMLEGTNRILLLANGYNLVEGKPEEVMRSKEVREVYMGGACEI